jgi:3-dehydroquinate synthase
MKGTSMEHWIHPLWTDDPWSQFARHLESKAYDGVFILMDENTRRYCLPLFLAHAAGLVHHPLVIPAGEQHKNLDTARYIWENLSRYQANRRSLMICLGGGVVSDIGGFCASTFHRGMDVLNVPTTLLAMADAALGGKNGVDLDSIKNQVGTTWMPAGVLIDPGFLGTLPLTELHAGFAEIVKHALIDGEDFWQRLCSPGTSPWTESARLPVIIAEAAAFKMRIVTQDPSEKGLRKVLNLGHTIGHALETHFLQRGESVSHGWAVAAGIQIENILSVLLGLLNEQTCREINAQLALWYPKLLLSEVDLSEILATMRADKKNRNGRISFSLLRSQGNVDTDCQTDNMDLIKKAILVYVED